MTTLAVAPLITLPFASSGDQSVVPSTDPNGFVNFTTGYTPDYEINLTTGDPNAKAVERGIQNYLFNALTAGLQGWQMESRPPWYATMPGGYNQWSEVVFPTDGSATPKPYRSLVSSNLSTPGSSTTWEYIEGTGELIQNVPMPSGGAAGPGSMQIATATNFNNFTTSGTFQFLTDAVVTGSPNYPTNGGNAATAGMLEVSAWTTGGVAYVTQMFRDRAGLGWMRGSVSGAWTGWKIWANATQFVVGEIRMWSGTATQAAITAAWGPGWHLCDGTLGTANLSGRFIIGAGTSYANGSVGGATTATLGVANMPAHNHVINIGDPGHNHSINQSPHAHGVSDPGHAHGVSDPGHNHVSPWGENTGSYSPPWGVYGSNNLIGSQNHDNDNSWGYTSPSGTGIGIYGNGTGIGIQAQYANVSNNASGTGISASSNNTGSGSAFAIMPPYYALCFVQYTGA